MSEHAATPWKTDGQAIDSADHTCVTEFEDGLYPEDKPNRARIVACVNFFHGQPIATERLEEGGVKELTDALIVAGGLLRFEAKMHKENGRPSTAKPLDGMADAIAALLTKLGIEP